MKQYLLSIYQPDGDPPPREVLEKVMRDVTAVREEMKAAGAWVFAGGLHPARQAAVLRTGGGVRVTDGPFAEAKEHVGGFCVIKAASRRAARSSQQALSTHDDRRSGKRVLRKRADRDARDVGGPDAEVGFA